jgi:uncharacterized membrane protein
MNLDLQLFQAHGAELSAEDACALRQTARDVSDLDPRTIQRAQAGFRHAYDIAQRVSDGSLDPLSA